MRRNWSTLLVARALGIMLLIPGLLQIPLPQADFHIIRHHHGVGEVCLKHDHLLRWHPQAGDCEGQGVAVLHWHWLLPKSLDSSLLENDARPTPSLHAHETDAAQPDSDAAPMLVREDRGREVGRTVASLSAEFSLGLIDRIDHPPSAIASSRSRDVASRALASSQTQARLVRWNC